MPYPRTRPLLGLLAAPLLLPALPRPVLAQERVEVETVEIPRTPGATNVIIRRGPRALLGVVTRPGGDAADTTGLLVERVTDSSAAGRAGIRVGERLAAIDGTPLTLDRRDVGDRAAGAVMQRRLERALEGKKPGDQVSLVVVGENNRRRTVRATLAEPPAPRSYAWSGPWGGASRTPRRVLGVTLGEGGSMRDTAGLLVTDVTRGSAAEKAGIGPGDRLVSIDGTDLRVDAADAGDGAATSARVGRLRRALDAAKDSQPVRLEVLQDGRRRTVTAVPQREQGWSWSGQGPVQFRGGDGEFEMMIPRDVELQALRAAQRGLEVQRRLLDGQARRIRVMTPDGAPMPPEPPMPPDVMLFERGPRAARVPGVAAPGAPRRGAMRVMVDGAAGPGGVPRYVRIDRADLDVATVNADLARMLGRGTEGGLLVLRVSDDQAPLKAGDVIMKVDGQAVTGRDARLDLRPDAAHRVEVIRDGKTQVLELKPH